MIEELKKLQNDIRDNTCDVAKSLVKAKKLGYKIKTEESGQIIRDCYQQAVPHLLNLHKAFAVSFTTGMGKTKAALLCTVNRKVLIVVKQNVHMDNWKREIQKWKINTDCTYVNYKSLHKHKNIHYDLMIFDECQAFTEKVYKNVRNIKYTYLLFLSATIPVSKKLIIKRFGTIILKVDLRTAMDLKILPELKLKIVPINLEYGERNQVWKFTKENSIGKLTMTYKQRFKAIAKNKEGYEVDVLCNQVEYVNMINENISYNMKLMYEFQQKAKEEEENKAKYKKQAEFFLIKAQRYGNDKKNYLAGLKVPFCKKLIDQIGQGKRFVVFTNTVDQCEDIARGKATCHSKHKDTLKNVTAFNNLEISELYAVRQLDESMNLTELDFGIILTLDNEMLANFQRLGRSTRSIEPLVYILYVRNTKDEKNLKKLLKESKLKYEQYEIM